MPRIFYCWHMRERRLKGLLYKLTDLALRENNIQEAEAYYREFCELSGDDPRQYLLRFLILEAKDAPLEQQINSSGEILSGRAG